MRYHFLLILVLISATLLACAPTYHQEVKPYPHNRYPEFNVSFDFSHNFAPPSSSIRIFECPAFGYPSLVTVTLFDSNIEVMGQYPSHSAYYRCYDEFLNIPGDFSTNKFNCYRSVPIISWQSVLSSKEALLAINHLLLCLNNYTYYYEGGLDGATYYIELYSGSSLERRLVFWSPSEPQFGSDIVTITKLLEQYGFSNSKPAAKSGYFATIDNTLYSNHLLSELKADFPSLLNSAVISSEGNIDALTSYIKPECQPEEYSPGCYIHEYPPNSHTLHNEEAP